MIKTHVIKLKPTKSQERFFKKSAGVARFAYNWALNKWQKDYFENGVRNSAFSLIKHLNSIKRKEFPWMQEVGKCAPQYAIHNLQYAFQRFFKKIGNEPKLKKKGKKDSFIAVENHLSFGQVNFKLWIPRLGWVKCCENLRFKGKVNYIAIKRTSDMWFAYINVEIEDTPIDMPSVNENQVTVGIDMGINSMLVLSDGTVFKNPKALQSNLKSLSRLHRGLDRKQIGSKNWRRHQVKLSRKYYRISCIRKNAINQATTAIVKKYDRIVIENLAVSNMIKNINISRALRDVSFGEITRQIKYKSDWSSKELVMADRFFASSKTCSNCGVKKNKILISQRVFKCSNCGLEMDRDLNAAKTLAKYSPTSELEGRQACGEGSSVLETVHSPSMKQEVNNSFTNLDFVD